jgi:L-ascorbate metabolism protein UlaG (beta-lactamase superfamily)
MMKITYCGHSCLMVEQDGKRVIIDPFLSGNPQSGMSPDSIHVDAVLLTHGHSDHFGDALQIAKANNCTIIAIHELAGYCASKGAAVHGMNVGGAFSFEGFRVKYTQAFHSNSVETENGFAHAGVAAGILLTMGDKTLFHAGDTALFSDLKLIGELNRIDIAALPIGDNYTMGPDEAVIAARWINAKDIIPLHYNTFPVIRQDPGRFVDMLKEEGLTGHAMASGDVIEI